MKRLFDLVASLLGLALTSPILVFVAVAIRLDSPGPVLFRQQRVGRGGDLFTLLKFRSMSVGGEGPQITAGGDPRITRVGRVIRDYKIDELPQLLNVLRGDMSIVGPRPEVERYVRAFADDFSPVLRVRPGLTDPASLEFRHEERLLAEASDPQALYEDEVLPAKLRLSTAYAESASMKSDLAIIAKTAYVAVRPSSAA